MLNLKDLYWVAGFLEGEGSFTLNGRTKAIPEIHVAQVQREPLDKLGRYLGGRIVGPYNYGASKGYSPFYKWGLYGTNAAALMMTLYPLMSPKRKEQIVKALVGWRSSDRNRKAYHGRVNANNIDSYFKSF